ncbi:MAG: hypothetical protein HY842_17055 [Bacteroidetes bacterium]|nr:hypothetical protein [Bacteroidota bacterium]
MTKYFYAPVKIPKLLFILALLLRHCLTHTRRPDLQGLVFKTYYGENPQKQWLRALPDGGFDVAGRGKGLRWPVANWPQLVNFITIHKIF